MNLAPKGCDKNRVGAFLADTLDVAAETEFTTHLETCSDCRRELASAAGSVDDWSSAESFLQDEEGDDISLSCVIDPMSREHLSNDQATGQIKNVLDVLAPSDDPAYLGRLEGYEISGVVGVGGMGVVLKGFDRALDRPVAIKVLAPHLATVAAARQRFAREAKAAAAILHPNVIPIHGVSNGGSLPYLVMPFVRGESLQRRIDRCGPLTARETLRIAQQVASGLAAAHSQGLVHRDIKPANVLLDDGVERVAITDFGLARAADDATMTRSGVIAGTPQFMSPEQARGEPLDGRSDLFSLGSLLYASCTGRPPFRAESSFGVLRRITDDTPRAIRELAPESPLWLVRLIDMLLEKSPDRRPDSAAAVEQLAAQSLKHLEHPDTVPLPFALQEPPEEKATEVGLIASGAAAAVGLVLIVLMLCIPAFMNTAEPTESSSNPQIVASDEGIEEKGIDIAQQGEPTRQVPDPTIRWDDDIQSDLDTLEVDIAELERQSKSIFPEPL